MSSDRIEALSRSLADSTSRRSLLKILGVGAAGTMVTAVGLNEAAAKGKRNNRKVKAQATGDNPFRDIPISGRDGEQQFEGVLNVQEFRAQDEQLVAVAELTGTVTKKNGKDKAISRQVILPVEASSQSAEVQAQAVCPILRLALGPIDLNLLGLRLHVDPILIVLDAVSGPGALLGNLLCAIAGLLDGGGLLSQIVDVLNDILDALSGALGGV
jgi:hypothetical protein